MTRQLFLAAVVLVLAATDCAARASDKGLPRKMRLLRRDRSEDDRFEMEHKFRGNITERLICRGANETDLPAIPGFLLPDAAWNMWEDMPHDEWMDMPDMDDMDDIQRRKSLRRRGGNDWGDFDSDFDDWNCDPETDRYLCLPIFPRPGLGNRTLAIPEIQELFENLVLLFDNGTLTSYAEFDTYITTAAQPILDTVNITTGIDMLKEMVWHHLVKSGHIPAGTIGPDGEPVPEDAGRRWDSDEDHYEKFMNLTGYWVSHDNIHWDNNRTETSGNTSLHFFWTPVATLFSHDGVNYSLCSNPWHDDHYDGHHGGHHGHHGDRDHHRHNRTDAVAETTFVASFATLSLDQWTEDDREAFVRAFQEDLAPTVGAEFPDDVVVHELRAGSVVVEASVLFDNTAAASAAAATLTDTPPADLLSTPFKASYGEATVANVAVETFNMTDSDEYDSDMEDSDMDTDEEESDREEDKDTEEVEEEEEGSSDSVTDSDAQSTSGTANREGGATDAGDGGAAETTDGVQQQAASPGTANTAPTDGEQAATPTSPTSSGAASAGGAGGAHLLALVLSAAGVLALSLL